MINPLDELIKHNYYSYNLILDIEFDINFINTALDIKINEELNIYHSDQFALKYNQNQIILYFINDNNFELIKNILKSLKLTNVENLKFKHINSSTTINVNYDNLTSMLELIQKSINLKQLEVYNKALELANYNYILQNIKEKEVKQIEKEAKQRKIDQRKKELEIENRGHNYYFWQDEQGCLYGGTEFKLEELEELQNKFIYQISERIYKRYITNFIKYREDDYNMDIKSMSERINNRLLHKYDPNLTKIINKMDFICFKTDYKLKGEIFTTIIIGINKILNSNNKDITNYLWDYEHTPYFKLNLPKFNKNELEMYDSLDYLYEYEKEKEKINEIETIISSPYIEEVKSNPSLIDEIESNYAIKCVNKNYYNKDYFNGFNSNANIEHKIMLALGYENKLYNYRLYNSSDTLSNSNIINDIDDMYETLNYNYNYECKIIRDFIKKNKIDMTKQLVFIIVHNYCYVFNCKMFKTEQHCLDYINEKKDECIKIDIKNIKKTLITTSINGNEKVYDNELNTFVVDDEENEVIIKKEITNTLTFKINTPIKPLIKVEETIE